MEIRHLKRDEIDELKWNSCVHYAGNGQIYGYTWYLDNVAEEWDGLIEGDYESVFPLVWNDKIFGIKQLYQPYLCQQLGLFSVNLLSKARLQKFMEAIPTPFKYWNFQINYHNAIPEEWGFDVSKRSNFELALYDDYETISSGYSNNLKRSLKKASKANLILTSNVKPERLVEMYRTHQGPRIGNLPDSFYHTAHRIIYNALHRGLGFMSGVSDREGNLLAAGFFLSSHHRIVNLMPSSSQEGREVCAMHYLLDMLIRGSAGRKVILDFEGSSIPNIARFYQSFGAIDVPFYQVKQNKLPFPLRLIKK